MIQIATIVDDGFQSVNDANQFPKEWDKIECVNRKHKHVLERMTNKVRKEEHKQSWAKMEKCK